MKKLVASILNVLLITQTSFAAVLRNHESEKNETPEHVGGFLRGTIVHTSMGPDLIQAVRKGHRLLSYNLETGEIVEGLVTKVHRTELNELAEVFINGESIVINPDHKIYVVNQNAFVKARNLRPGEDTVYTADRKELPIDKVIVDTGVKEVLYDFTVEGTENYFVGEQKILVHNFAFLAAIFAWMISSAGLTWLGSAAIVGAFGGTIGLGVNWGGPKTDSYGRHNPIGMYNPYDRTSQPRDRLHFDMGQEQIQTGMDELYNDLQRYKRNGPGNPNIGFSIPPIIKDKIPSVPKDNTNPYAGPVGEVVNTVDPKGNNIRVNPGEWIQGSRDGKYQQVVDSNGEKTGVRKDGPHLGKLHENVPEAQVPHAHVPGKKNADGGDWLPVNQ